MARSKRKPRWDYRGDKLYLDGVADAYTEELVRKLMDDFGIVDALEAEALELCLGRAADEYRTLKESEVDAPRPGEVLAALAEIEKRAKALDAVIGKIDTATWDALKAAQARLYTRESERPEAEGYLDMGQGFHVERVKLADGTMRSLKTTWEDIYRAQRLLIRLCDDARRNLPKDKGGPRDDVAIRRWVETVSDFWTETLGRRFTLDAYAKAPVSKAARFCWAAFRPLEPEARPVTLMNAMRRVIAEARRSKTRKNPSPK